MATKSSTSDAQFYFLLFFIWFLSAYLFRILFKQTTKNEKTSPNFRHPPSPRSLPLIGHLHLLGPVLSKCFQNLSNRHGPLMRLHIGRSSTAVIVSNSEMAKEMLKNNEMNFVSRPDFGASDFNIYHESKFVNAEYGTYWRFMKKVCMTELLSVTQLNKFSDIRREELDKLLEILARKAQGKDLSDLGVEFLKMTNNVICRMAMSTRCSSNADESKVVMGFVKGVLDLAPKFSLGEFLGPLGKLDLFGYGRRIKELFLQFDGLVERIMVEHERDMEDGNKEKKDMMDILLKVHKDENAEVKITRIDIKSFLMELFMAGTETVSVALLWTLAELINHPQVYKKLRQEINDVVSSSNRRVQESDIPNLPYLQAVVKESLRLHPPAPLIFRKSQHHCKINGYDISENERVIFNLYAIMRDPGAWEKPTDFVPERFYSDGNNSQMDIKGLNFNVFPFGSGRRSCPGASLALTVVQSTIGAVVQCFDFEVPGGDGVSTEEGSGFSAGMANPLLCYPVIKFNPLDAAAEE